MLRPVPSNRTQGNTGSGPQRVEAIPYRLRNSGRGSTGTHPSGAAASTLG